MDILTQIGSWVIYAIVGFAYAGLALLVFSIFLAMALAIIVPQIKGLKGQSSDSSEASSEADTEKHQEKYQGFRQDR